MQASTSAAGIVGHWKSITNAPTILTCVNSGSVFAGTNAGGIAGIIEESSPSYVTVSQSLNLGVINAGAYAGGIVGNINKGAFYADHNMNAGAVGFGYAGGIVGRVKAGASEKVSANLSIAAPDTFAIYDSVMSHFEEDCLYPVDAAHAYVTDSLISGKTAWTKSRRLPPSARSPSPFRSAPSWCSGSRGMSCCQAFPASGAAPAGT